MTVKHSLLALLAEGPKYGYQLKTEFESATGGSTTLNIGQVYTTLQRLERDGLAVEHTQVDPTSGTDERRSYRLTQLGRKAVADWFETPSATSTTQRDEVSIKILVAVASGASDPHVVIRSQRNATTATLQKLTRQKVSTHGLAENLNIERQIMASEAELRWLDLAEDRIIHAQKSPEVQQ